MISASATGIWKNTHLRGTEGKWNLLDSENPDMHQNHWTERRVRKWWNSLIPNHSLTSWTAKFSSTEGKLMSEKKIVQISTWTRGCPEGNVAEQGEFAWSHMAALAFYSESLDKFGTAWGRGKFGVASLLSNDSIRLVVELVCHGRVFVLLEMWHSTLLGLGWWWPRVTAMSCALTADGELCVVSKQGNLALWCCGLLWLKCLVRKIFHPKFKFRF